MAKAKITRIKATDSKKVEKKTEIKKQKPVETKAEAKKDKKVFILFRPFCAIGRYIRDSWREIRQVRWPNRKATWKMVLAVIIYTAIFVVVLVLLDLFFQFLFNKILG